MENLSPVSPVSVYRNERSHRNPFRFRSAAYEELPMDEKYLRDESNQAAASPLDHPIEGHFSRSDQTAYWSIRENPFEDSDYDLGERKDPKELSTLHAFGHGPYMHPRSGDDMEEKLVTKPPLEGNGLELAAMPQDLTMPACLACPAKRDIIASACSLLPMMILLAAMYATILSLAGIIVAHREQEFSIDSPGAVSYSVATSICTALAKTVELSLVTVVIAVIGQILSRRARGLSNRSYGVSIAEMSMRTWIMQPGTMLYHAATVRHAGPSLLGMVAIWTTVVATLYTTAAEALIYPKLRLGVPESLELSGRVLTSFANNKFLAESCPIPIIDGDLSRLGNACLHLAYAGQSIHNLQMYLGRWNGTDEHGYPLHPSDEILGRPAPKAVLDDDLPTTVLGQWVRGKAKDFSAKRGDRVIQVATMALPHLNVLSAARPGADRLLRTTLGKDSGMDLSAAVSAPSVQIVCAGLRDHELNYFLSTAGPRTSTPLATQVADIFDFGAEQDQQDTPQFDKAPNASNTVVSNQQNVSPRNASAYLLAAVPGEYAGDDEFMLCSIQAHQYLKCTTHYQISRAGAKLSVHCDDDALNDLPYQDLADESNKTTLPLPDFQIIANEWLRANALNNGVDNANASIARILTQLIPVSTPVDATMLEPDKPSIAEAIAVLAARPLLMSSIGAPFIHYFDYPPGEHRHNILAKPVQEPFKALLAVQAYRSGPTNNWQKAFFLVLWSACAISAVSSFYLFWLYCVGQHGDIIDFTEPQNAFAMAINSPSSTAVAGACGGGPESEQWRVKWMVQASRSDAQEDESGGSLRPHYAWASVGSHVKIA